VVALATVTPGRVAAGRPLASGEGRSNIMDAIEILTALSTSEGRADPYPLYAALHEKGEVIKIGPGDVMVVGYDAISSVLRDPGFRVSDESAFDKDFPSWRANRFLFRVWTGS
jgi:cytochrome P450